MMSSFNNRRPRSAMVRGTNEVERDRNPLTSFHSRAASLRPQSAVDRFRKRDSSNSLKGYRCRNLFEAHVRRLQSREADTDRRSEIDRQLDALAQSMRTKSNNHEEKRAVEMAAHVSLAKDRRRNSLPNRAPVKKVEYISSAGKRLEESMKAYGRGAASHVRHQPETEAEQWLEEMWLAKRTKEYVERRYETQVKRALMAWEDEKNRRDLEFARKQEIKRKQANVGQRFPSSNNNNNGPPRKSQLGKAWTSVEIPSNPEDRGRNKSAGCIEDLRKQPVALPRERARSIGTMDDLHILRSASVQQKKASGRKAARPQTAKPRKSKPSSNQREELDQEFLIYEQARLERMPTYNKDTVTSVVFNEQHEECRNIMAAFERKGISISLDVLCRALIIPQDRPEHECVKNLPVPGSTLLKNPNQIEKSQTGKKAAKKKKKKK